MTESKPKILIILLTWNNIEDTLECIYSIRKQDYSSLDILLVDNASSDGTVDIVKKAYPEITIIKNTSNLGYAEGNNIGINYALSQDYYGIFILNNDTVLAENCLSELVDELQHHSDAGAVAPISFYYCQKNRIYFAGGKITPRGYPVHVHYKEEYFDSININPTTDWLNGCAILFRSQTLRVVGGFDPKFYLLFEDVDWSLRAKKYGYSLRIAGKSHLWHKISVSFGATWSPQYLYYYTRNSLYFIKNHFPLIRRYYYYYFAIRRSFQVARKPKSFSGEENILLGVAVKNGLLDFFFERMYKRDFQ